MRPGPGGTPGTRCGSWPRPGRGTPACWHRTAPSAGSQPASCAPATGSWSGPGERIAADGEVEFGESAVDRSMMTGEPVPADAAEGDTVTAGTVVVTGRLVVRAVKVGATPSSRTW